MYRLKGFVNIEPVVPNTTGITALIGEISTYSLTYSKDVGTYTSSTLAKYSLKSFASAYSSTGRAPVPQTIQDQVFEFSEWTYQKQSISTRAITKNAFLVDLVDQFSNSATQIDCGELIQATSTLLFPEWISWKKTGIANGNPAQDNTIIVWFSDASFRDQYDEFEIVVIPPLPSIDTFYAGKPAVVAALAAITPTQSLAAVVTAKGQYPETVLLAENFNYVDPITSTTVATSWYVLIYGKAGNDLDAIRDAIRVYIAAHTTHTELEWKAIIPDVYKNTEFIIYPRWKNFAIPDRDLQVGTYSPSVKIGKELAYAKLRHPSFSTLHMDTHTAVIPCNYRSLALLIIGSPDNRNSLFSITSVYPDIINLPTSDGLFESMALDTQLWITGVQTMLVAAETATTFSPLPGGLRKTVRNGIVYVTAKFKNINYLVATKLSTPNYS